MEFDIKINVLNNFLSFLLKVLLSSLICILSTVIFLYLFYFFDMISNLKSRSYEYPLFNTYIVVTPSMTPNINVKDAIFIKRVKKKDLKIGDVITFNSNDPRYLGMTVTHRIVDIYKDKMGNNIYKTKGDANKYQDLSITKYSDIHGKVILKIPKLGKVLGLLTNIYLWLFVISLPFLISCLYNIYKFILKIVKVNNFN